MMPHRKTRGVVSFALVLLGGITMATGSRAAPLPPATDALLRSSSYIYVATQRKDGQQGAASPIWFMWDDGKIFFTTGPESWKAKRIARGSPLTIHVGSADGPKLIGKARQVKDPALVEQMGRAYSEKYWIAWLGLFRPRSDRVTTGKTAAYLVDVEPQ